jgi:hypothetical protein
MKSERDNFRRSTKRTLSQLRPRPQTQSGRMPPAQWTHPQAPADAQWTQDGRTAPAGRTHPPVDAQWTQDTRVLDAVFDKLFLGSTVLSCKMYAHRCYHHSSMFVGISVIQSIFMPSSNSSHTIMYFVAMIKLTTGFPKICIVKH